MVSRRATGILVLIWCLAATPAWADFTCEASVDRTSVPSGGEVVLTVAARGDVGWSPEFELPEMPRVRIYAGGTNQSMSMVNGATETSVARTYYLKVDTEADFTIGPIKIVTAKGQCTTEPLAITVTDAVDDPAGVPPAHSGNRLPRDREPAAGNKNPAAGAPGDDIFVTLSADHTEAWVGQQVVLTFRYWRRVQPWNNPSYTPPRTEGFWREDLGAERNYRKVLGGRAYNVTEIRYAIFPTRVGDLVVEPAELSFPEGVFDRFFGSRRARRGPSILRTDPVTIRVKALPRPHPANYSGVVATRLKLISQADRDTVPRGEAVGLKVLLNADGFLKGFSGLEIPPVAGTRMHDAGESFETMVLDDRLTGKITIEKVIVPDQEGVLEIPAVSLVWFDATAGEFRTERTAAWPVTVVPSDLPRAGSDDSGFLRSEVARLAEDLAFIRQVPHSLSRRSGPVTGGGLWWLLLGLPLLLLGGFRLLLSRLAAERRDPAGRRRRRALATARATLQSAEGDRLSGVVRAVCGYVADCHDRPLASVDPASVGSYCRDLGLVDVGDRLREILAECDAARYGNVDAREVADLVREAGDLLARLDARRREHGGRVPVPGALAMLALAGALALGSPASADQTAGPRPGVDPLRLVAEGNQAYTTGRLADATASYLRARDAGVNDPVLHFNLGNAYARSGQLGEAVASYLRAQRLDPRNRDIKANLAWVRRHIRDLELGDESLPLFIAQFVGVVRTLTLDQWGGVLIGLTWVVAALVAWVWYREELTTNLRRTLLGMVAALVIVAAITGGRWYVEEVRDTAVVVVPEAVVRSGPADNFSALFEIHDGLTLSIVGRREGWVRVGLGGNWEGWVPARSVVPVRLPATVQGR